MSIVKHEEIIAYSDDKKVYCPDCVNDITGLKAIFQDSDNDEAVICDICGKIQ